MVCALCVRVLITLYLAAKLWLLSHWSYRSVCVGFLYTPMVKVNRNIGKYYLPHIWDKILFTIPELKMHK